MQRRVPSFRPLAASTALALALAGCGVYEVVQPLSAVERNQYQRPSSPEEIANFLAALARHDDIARLVKIGRSAGGRPLGALLLGRHPAAVGRAPSRSRPLTVLIIGSQHGTEPSGGEAIQLLAGAIVSGAAEGLLDVFDFILVPDANPDGRARHRRVNGNGVNLSTNYNTASEPEVRAVLDALARWRPDVVLDVHESAILKKKSLGAQGYMTDFETQIELANNPNVDGEVRALSDTLLAETIAGISAAGGRAQRYMGEITDVAQPITHGGLSVKNLRNAAGMRGTVSFLIENRLDPPGVNFPTPRNLRARVEKQRKGIEAFLEACRRHRDEIRSVTTRARDPSRAAESGPVYLQARYAPNPQRQRVSVPLRRIADGELVERPFALHDVVETLHSLPPPRAYAVVAETERLATVLDREHVAYRRLAAPVDVLATVLQVCARVSVPGRHGWSYSDYELGERRRSVTLPAGSLWVDLAQSGGRLVPLLLEPRSNGGVFQDPAYAPLLHVGEEFFIYRVESAGERDTR